jgi:PKD-like domain
LLSSTLSPSAICNGTTFSYTPTSTVADSTFTWNRAAAVGISQSASSGTGDISEILTNTTSTTINVTYVITANGCSGSAQSIVVSVKPTPAYSSTFSPAAICSGSTFAYTPTSAVAGSTFAWSRAVVVGINQAASSGTGNISEVLTNTTSAAINVTYIVTTTASGCSGSQNVVVSVSPTPSLSSTLSPAATCSGSTFSYTPTSAVSSSTFIWNRAAVVGISQAAFSGTGNISEVLTNTTAAPINVTYIITTTANGCSCPQNVVISVNPLFTANISASDVTTFCQGGSVTLTASVGSSYLWSTGATTQGITVNASGNYSVTVTNANNCSATSSATTIIVNSLPAADISASGSTIFCQGGSVTLTASAGSSYLWSTGATTQATTLNASGNYSVTVTDLNGCPATSSATTVTVNPLPTPTISTSGTACANSNGVPYSVTNTAGSSYVWAITGGTQASGTNTNSITVNWGAAGAGNVSVVEANTVGCTGSATNKSVTKNSIPSTSAITGNGTVCTNTNGVGYSVTNTTGSSYAWTIAGGT